MEGSSIKLDHFCEVSGFLCLHYYDYDDDDDDYEDDDDDANYDDDYENDDDKMRKGNLDLNTLSIKLFSALFEFWITWLPRGVLEGYFKISDDDYDDDYEMTMIIIILIMIMIMIMIMRGHLQRRSEVAASSNSSSNLRWGV